MVKANHNLPKPPTQPQSRPPIKQQPNPPGSRLDEIYAQLKQLQSYKDEILGDLDDFIDEVETNKNIELPKQIDEVVEIVVNEERQRAETIENLQESVTDQNELAKAMEELMG